MNNKIVRVEVIHKFRLSEYDKIYNIKRMDNTQEYNRFIKGDIFECEPEFCKYLMEGTKVVRVIEVLNENDIKLT